MRWKNNGKTDGRTEQALFYNRYWEFKAFANGPYERNNVDEVSSNVGAIHSRGLDRTGPADVDTDTAVTRQSIREML